MEITEIEEKVRQIKAELSSGNVFGERVFLVAATKTQSAECINAAIRGGADAVAENKVQEFREKTEFLLPCPQHFIGHLQTNKVKYLVGKISLFHSCDRDELAEEISRISVKKNVRSEVLIQVNIGREITKGGYAPEEALEAWERLREKEGLLVRGFMAMLPDSDDQELLADLTDEMRAVYDTARRKDENLSFLSMGMSGDYKLCIAHGSNMIRLGSTLFGARNYQKSPM